ncbi:hypothetical protein [Streptomyces sp. NPDC002403]
MHSLITAVTAHDEAALFLARPGDFTSATATTPTTSTACQVRR